MGNGQGESAGSAAIEAGTSPPDGQATGGGDRARRVAFRTLAVLLSMWVLARTVFGLLEVGLMWLPFETLEPILEGEAGSAPELEAHRSHYMSIGIVAWAQVLAVLAQVRRPHRREAQMVWALAIATVGAIVFALSGTVGEWLLAEGTLLLPVIVLALLHPRSRSLMRLPGHDRPMLGLSILAAVPWLVFAVTQARHQWRDHAGDIHAEPEHWAIVALMALTIVAAALIGSGERPGWRLPAWFAAVATVVWAVHSLVFPTATSAAPTIWAIVAIGWGVAFAVTILRRQRPRATVGVSTCLPG